ncbi:sugar phosphate isomerase/epimerase family protein [Planctomicrobium sp. SH664]|uniref:sugar phosphate isomerase/epimerase family protein n=1 Tax=Planctomicrobium sp. SH664 TaxID=3448125 RepID=UPI003F5C74CD
MKFGINLLLWTGRVDEEHFPVIEKIKEWGYDGVELPIFEYDLPRAEKIGKKLRELGLGATSVTAGTVEHNLVSPDASVRASGVTYLKKMVDMAAASGATHLVGPIHSALGAFTGSGPTAEEWKWSQEGLAVVADHAAAQNVILGLECLNRFECYLMNTVSAAARFARELGHSHVKMMYDTFHANIEEKDIFAAVESCKDQLCHVHISENDRSTPGEGQVNWKDSFAALKKANYDGWLTIEAFGLALPEVAAATRIWRRMFTSEEALARNGLKFMKAGWEEAQA